VESQQGAGRRSERRAHSDVKSRRKKVAGRRKGLAGAVTNWLSWVGGPALNKSKAEGNQRRGKQCEPLREDDHQKRRKKGEDKLKGRLKRRD